MMMYRLIARGFATEESVAPYHAQARGINATRKDGNRKTPWQQSGEVSWPSEGQRRQMLYAKRLRVMTTSRLLNAFSTLLLIKSAGHQGCKS